MRPKFTLPCFLILSACAIGLWSNTAAAKDATLNAAEQCIAMSDALMATKDKPQDQITRAIGYCTQVAEVKQIKGENRFKVLIRRAMLHQMAKEPQLALDDANAAIKSYKKDGMGYLLRGQLYAGDLKDCDSAIDDFSKALKYQKGEDKKNEQAYLLRGSCYMKLSEKDKAKKDFKKTLEINPDNKLAQANLIMVDLDFPGAPWNKK